MNRRSFISGTKKKISKLIGIGSRVRYAPEYTMDRLRLHIHKAGTITGDIPGEWVIQWDDHQPWDKRIIIKDIIVVDEYGPGIMHPRTKVMNE